jgi:hypothetical protein
MLQWVAFKTEINCVIFYVSVEAEENADDTNPAFEVSARNTISSPLRDADCELS